MKDSNDKQTLDLLDKPRRGRPVTGNAKTQAQIQREYRARKKAQLQALKGPLTHHLTGQPVEQLPFSFALTIAEIDCARHALCQLYLERGKGWTDKAAFQLFNKLGDYDPFPVNGRAPGSS